MNERKRLGSWKEIAAHLHVETRTAMRWEHERALPVHRVPGGGRAAVFAYADEIDAWLHGQPAESLTEDAAAQPRGGNGPNGISAAAPVAAQEAPPFDFASLGFARGRQGKRRMSRGAAIALVGALAVVLLTLFVATRSGKTGAAEIARVTFVGEKIIAWDDGGRELWRYAVPGQLAKIGGGITSTVLEEEPARLVDLDGDGHPEVLAVTHTKAIGREKDAARSELLCISSDGTLRWRYALDAKLRFGDKEFEGPWTIYDLVVSRGPRREIWLAVNHHQWWPSFVVKLDAAGRTTVLFVNSGVTYSLNLVESGGRRLLLAGGVNNEPYQGALAVFDAGWPAGASPQEKETYRCRECPAGKPLAYFLFPRSELNLVDRGPLNVVQDIRQAGARLSAHTIELPPGEIAFYQFSEDITAGPASYSLSDGYWVRHRELEREGKVKHTVEQCPDRTQPKLVRRWTPATGWAVVSVPSVPLN
ncbi:MAG: VCBS repeat-containing protein [Acidobacteria bacterium]|nr:VCBS repeat-containing protein [Acidobacteriota bacterium]